MSEETIYLNDITRFGLRRLHLMQMGAAIDEDPWIERVPVQCMDTLTIAPWHEDTLDIYHLELWWKARELVTITCPDGKKINAVMWWIGKQDKRVPEQAVEYAEEVFGHCIEEIQASWIPAGFVVLVPGGK